MSIPVAEEDPDDVEEDRDLMEENDTSGERGKPCNFDNNYSRAGILPDSRISIICTLCMWLLIGRMYV